MCYLLLDILEHPPAEALFGSLLVAALPARFPGATTRSWREKNDDATACRNRPLGEWTGRRRNSQCRARRPEAFLMSGRRRLS